MAGSPDTAALLELAKKAETLGYDSVWVGDSLLARPRHEPLTCSRRRGANAAGRARHRGAVACAPAIPSCSPTRWPPLTGSPRPADPRRGSRHRRGERSRRVRVGGRAVRETRRAHARGAASVPSPLVRRAHRLGRPLAGEAGSPRPHPAPPRWPARLDRWIRSREPGTGGPALRRLVSDPGPTPHDGASSGATCSRLQRRSGERPAPSPRGLPNPRDRRRRSGGKRPDRRVPGAILRRHRRLRCASAKPASRARRTRPRAGSGATQRPARVISCSASSGITMPCSRRWPGSVPISVGQAPGGSPFRTGASLQRPRTRPPPADTKTSLPATAAPFT